MTNLLLSWQQGSALAAGLFVAGGVSRALASGSENAGDDRPSGEIHARHTIAVRAWPALIEAGIIASLYALWQFAGSLALDDTHGALARGRSILRLEARWHLPRE